MTTKDEAIRKVLLQRKAVIEEHILPNPNQTPLNRAYYEGKRDGYNQALDLLSETLESIRIELQTK